MILKLFINEQSYFHNLLWGLSFVCLSEFLVSVPDSEPGYKCECVQDYVVDPHDAAQCKARDGHPSLLFAHKTDIRKLSLDRPSMTAIVNNTRYTLQYSDR